MLRWSTGHSVIHSGPAPRLGCGSALRPTRPCNLGGVHVVIMGCGRTGASLAHSLIDAGHTVAVIDRDIAAFRRLGSGFGGRVITGNGFDRGVLITAGITDAEAFAAVGNGDNSNIIAARVARETFGVQRVVARIYDAGRAAVYERLGIPTIATVRWTAHQVLRALSPGEDPELWREPSSAVAVIQPRLHPGWVGRNLADWERTVGVRAAYITRFGQAELPTASTVIAEGDRLGVPVTDDIVEHVVAVTGAAPTEPSGAEE